MYLVLAFLVIGLRLYIRWLILFSRLDFIASIE